MATYTENLNLKLPATTDYFSIQDFNNNFTAIDTFLTNLGISLNSMSTLLETVLEGGDPADDDT